MERCVYFLGQRPGIRPPSTAGHKTSHRASDAGQPHRCLRLEFLEKDGALDSYLGESFFFPSSRLPDQLRRQWRYITIPNRSLPEIKTYLQEWTKRSAPRTVSLCLWNVGRESWSKEQTIPASLDGLRIALSLLRGKARVWFLLFPPFGCDQCVLDRIGRLEIHFQRSSAVIGIFSSIISDSRLKLSALSEIWIDFIDPPDGTIVIPERTFQVSPLSTPSSP